MDIEYSATARAATTEPFHCAKCGYAGRGHATAVENATVQRGGLLFGNDRAGEMAVDEAEAAAWQQAMSDVAMAPCPRCGAVDRSAWVAWMRRPGYLLKLALGTLAFVMGLVLLAAIFTAANLQSLLCAVAGGLLLVPTGLLVAILPLVSKRASTRRVRFDPPR